MILSGSTSQAVGIALADRLQLPVVPLSYSRFPDGELLVEVDRADSSSHGIGPDGGLAIEDRAIVVASTPTAAAHIELLQLQDIARSAGAREVVTVIPYLGYARQEVAHEPGQPASARAVAVALGANADRVITVNPHEDLVCDYFPVPATAVCAADSLAGTIDVGDDPLVLAPDEGALDLAESLRDAIGDGEVDHFVKERLSGDEVRITPSETDVSGREAIIVDDIIATGSTIATATDHLVEGGIDRVHVACVHALFIGGAYSRLRRAGVSSIVATDTLERLVSETTAADAIAEALS